MAVCKECGKETKTKAKFCPSCGTEFGTTKKKETPKTEEIGEVIKDKVEKVLDTEDSTKEYEKKDAKDNLAMALLSYLGFLVLIPYFLEKNSKFVRYHAVQGMNLLVIWVGYSVLSGLLGLIKVTKSITYWGYVYGTMKITPWWINVPVYLLGSAIGILAIIGIVYVCQGKAKELPIINKLKIFK
jgi:uncharacterized membrane protein